MTPKFRILTANIALGIPGADSPLRSLSMLLRFYGWKIISFLLTGGRLSWLFDYTVRPREKRVAFFHANSTLRPVLELIETVDPDVVILSELLIQVHRGPLEEGLRKLGFIHIAWGPSLQPPDLVASRLPCLLEGFAPTMMQLPQISGGAGIAGLRLLEYPLTIVGAHLTNGLRELSEQQIEDLAGIYESERSTGRVTILAGDFNERGSYLEQTPSFSRLGLRTVTKRPTVPLGFPGFLQADYDHIFIPPGWRASETRYRSFGSDHLAVVSEVLAWQGLARHVL